MTIVAQSGTGLPAAFRRKWQTMALPVVFVLIAVELQRHWEGLAKWLYITCIALVLITWLGALMEKAWAKRFGGNLVDAVIFLFLIGCIILGTGYGDLAAVESAKKLLFWSPLICLWWTYQHREYWPRLLTNEIALFAGLSVVHTDKPELLLEYLLLAAMVTSLAWFATGRTAHPAQQVDEAAMKEASKVDSVTNLPSPERFEDELALTVAVADRYRIPFSLLVCEIKGLADYAADKGNPAANEMIKRFAWRIADEIRVADTLCRWEEGKFVILLPNTDITGSQILVDRIRHAAEALFYPEGAPTEVRIGISQHQFGDDPMATFSMAEAALLAEGELPSGN